jgi:hypothetical protein
MASVANRLAAQTIEHASRRRQRGFAKIGAAKIDLVSQAIPTPGNERKIVRSNRDFARNPLAALRNVGDDAVKRGKDTVHAYQSN